MAGISHDEEGRLKKATEAFCQQYMDKEPYADYMSTVGPDSSEDGQRPVILVELVRALPGDLALPTEFDGFPVELRVTGPIRFHKCSKAG